MSPSSPAFFNTPTSRYASPSPGFDVGIDLNRAAPSGSTVCRGPLHFSHASPARSGLSQSGLSQTGKSHGEAAALQELYSESHIDDMSQ